MSENNYPSKDVEFIEAIDQQLIGFIQSSEAQLEMNPMNGYQRRLVHQLAGFYHLASESAGEGEGRFIRINRTEETGLSENKENFLEALFKELKTSDNEKPPRREKQDSRPPRGRTDRKRAPEPSENGASDFGNKIFQAKRGTTIVIREDGSFGVPRKEDKFPILDERVIEGNVFRIQKSKIVCPGDEEWSLN